MSIYTNEVSESPLFKRYAKLAGIDGITAAEVQKLSGLILDIADQVGPKMAKIGETFRQYTDHSLTHLINIAGLIDKFLPESKKTGKTVVGLNALELTFLWAGILLHDVGMFVTESEKEAELKTEAYRKFKLRNKDRVEAAAQARSAGKERRALAIEEAMIAEYYRRTHAKRSHEYTLQHLSQRLVFRDVDFAKEVAELAESHNWRVFQRDAGLSTEGYVAQFETDRRIDNVPVNLQYLACCLRMGDILDFDRSRTPVVVFDHMDFTEDISMVEWNKHRSIKGWKIEERELHFRAECERPEYYVAVQEFLRWVDTELDNFHRIVENFKDATRKRYPLLLPTHVKRDHVRMKDKNHITGAFKYQLEFEEIMQLLMDRSLYPDPALFLRELLQNSLDACRYQQALAKKAGMEDKYIPRIDVWDYSKDEENPRIIFRDNGIGMDLRTIEQYFLRVGKSYYRSPEFLTERELLAEQGIYLDSYSRFGIGFLSCFLAGDRIEVETHRYGSKPLKVTITGASKYFLIESLPTETAEISYLSPSDRLDDGPPVYSGTKVTVHLKDKWREGFEESKSGVVFDTINTYAVATEFPVRISIPPIAQVKEVSGRSFYSMPFPKRHYHEDNDKPHPFESILTLIPIPLPEGDIGLQFQGSLFVLMFRDNTAFGGRTSNGFTLSVGGGYRAEPEEFIELGYRGNILTVIQTFFLIWKYIYEPVNSTSISSLFESINFYLKQFLLEWKSLNENEKSLVKKIVCSTHPKNEKELLDEEALANAILDSNIEAITRLLIHKSDHSGIEQFSIPKQELALYGILTPNGVWKWESLRAYGYSLSFLPTEVFGKVNLVGGSAPIPSPNRLEVSPETTILFKKELNSSILRWALQGLNSHFGDSAWEEFFDSLLSSCMRLSPEAVLANLERLADRITIPFYHQDEPLEDQSESEPLDFEDFHESTANLSEIILKLKPTDIPENVNNVVYEFLLASSKLLSQKANPTTQKIQQLLNENVSRNEEPDDLFKFNLILFEFLTKLADETGNNEKSLDVRRDKHETLINALIQHKAYLPVRTWEYYRAEQEPKGYEDLAIFSEAPLIKDENGQKFRDLTDWVKKYLPDMKF